MKKAWTDLKSFITVAVIFLFAYCVIRQISIPEELKSITLMVVSFFLGSKASKNDDKKEVSSNE